MVKRILTIVAVTLGAALMMTGCKEYEDFSNTTSSYVERSPILSMTDSEPTNEEDKISSENHTEISSVSSFESSSESRTEISSGSSSESSTESRTEISSGSSSESSIKSRTEISSSSSSESSSQKSSVTSVIPEPVQSTSSITSKPSGSKSESTKPEQVMPEVSKSEITLVSMTNPLRRNEDATIMIKGKPNTEYSINVYYKSGKSTAKGLNNKVSDGDGIVSWTWHVGGKTESGKRGIVISGGGQTLNLTFTVVDSY